jgi:proteasome assembly chaperone (PAC2) family protein
MGVGVDQLRIGDVPKLRDPALVVAFEGWSDAGQAATGAARFLINTWSATRLGDIDPEEFYNFSEQRPQVKLSDGLLRTLEWPANECFYHTGGSERDFLIWVGVEPHLRWRLFTDAVMDLVSRCGVTLVVSLGGLLADVPHSRPIRVTGASTDELIQQRMRGVIVSGSRYEGPTGILGVLGDRFRRLGLPTASLWANVPHYINASANPRATAALLERLNAMFKLELDLHELDTASARFEREVSEAVEGDADISAYVRQLEEKADAESVEREERSTLPSGDAVVRELEEFLRRRQSGDEGSDPEAR